MIAILPVTFFVLWFYRYQNSKNYIEGLVQAEIIFHAYLLLITNVFSIFSCLNKYTVIFGWLVVVFITVFLSAKNYNATPSTFVLDGKKLFADGWDFAKKVSLIEKAMLIVMAVLGLILLFGAIFTVPYNYDSMTYHLGRMAHWIDNQSVNYFITNIDRQIYSPVLAEYELLHLYLLGGSDTFLNMPQYFTMLITAVIIYSTTKKLGTKRNFSLLSAFLFVTMPLTISQAVTTQNDLMGTLWFAIFLYYLVDFIRFEQINLKNGQLFQTICIGASVAFAFLTKTSICASMIFFMPWLLIVCMKRKDSLLNLIKCGAVAVVTLLVLIAETLVRTYLSCGKLVADTTSSNIMVATKNIKYILVNITKNYCLLITQHICRPLNGFMYRISIGLGSRLQVDFNNEAISYHGFDFLNHMNMGADMYSHDKTPSAVVSYLALLCGFIILIASILFVISLLKKTKTSDDFLSRIDLGFAISTWLSLGFIMALLRWQPWGSRLMYPALAMTVIMTGNLLGGLFKKLDTIPLFVVILLASILCISPVAYNMMPAIENVQDGCNNRLAKYFRFNDRFSAYCQLIDETKDLDIDNLGVFISGDGYDYPLWAMYKKMAPSLRLTPVILDENDSKHLDQSTTYPEYILFIEAGKLEPGETKVYHGKTYECIYVSDVNPDAPDSILKLVE